jgi:hypothetical protein
MIDTTSNLATTPSIVPLWLKKLTQKGRARNQIMNIKSGINKPLVNKIMESHFCSLGYNPDDAKFLNLILDIGETMLTEQISKMAHFVFIQS